MNASPPPKWGDLGIRAGSAALLIPLVLLCDWAGGFWFHLFALLLGCMIAYEWTKIVHARNQLQAALHIGAAVAGTWLPETLGVWPAVLAVGALALASILFARFGDKPASNWSYFGVLYVGFPVIALIVLRSDTLYGALAVLWVFVIVWAADIVAYFAGRTIGGPKLAPAISPKKTWAGLGGAVAGSAAASAAFAYFAQLEGIVILTVLAGALAIVEQGGDLFESALKRSFAVKDSGQLIPGHGGVIDRVDGLIAVSVACVLIGLVRQNGEYAAQGLLIW
jgi:phosphatidate cytidylyltransferase